MNRTLSRRGLLAGVAAATLLGAGALRGAAARFRSRSKHPSPRPGAPLATVRVDNDGRSVLAAPRVSFVQFFAPGAVPGGSRIELRAEGGIRAIPMQLGQKATWLQDGSWKTIEISFVAPDRIAPRHRIAYRLWRVP